VIKVSARATIHINATEKTKVLNPFSFVEVIEETVDIVKSPLLVN